MDIDFSSIPEYVLFKELTSLDEIHGRVMIDLNYNPTYFKKEERKEVFRALLEYYKGNNFKELLDEYIVLLSKRSYANFASIGNCNTFEFNHPIVVMIYEFIGQGLITKELEINSSIKKIELGNLLLTDKIKARELNIAEGVIFADGTLLRIESKDGHKIATLWMLLNGRSLGKAVRYTDDCIHPEPIFTSMNEYANLGDGSIIITEEQARAIYNIHMAKSNAYVDFKDILFNSTDLCIHANGNPEIRYINLKTFEKVLGDDIIKARTIIEDIRHQGYGAD